MTKEEKDLLADVHATLLDMREQQGWMKGRLEEVHAAASRIPFLVTAVERHSGSIRLLFLATAGGIITTIVLWVAHLGRVIGIG